MFHLFQKLAVHIPDNTAVEEPWSASRQNGFPPTSTNIYACSDFDGQLWTFDSTKCDYTHP